MNQKLIGFNKIWILICLMSISFTIYGTGHTEMIVKYKDKTEQTIEIPEDGKIYFSETDLIVDKGEASPLQISLSSIEKLNFSSANTSIGEVKKNDGTHIYPNPARNEIFVANTGTNKMSVKIISLSGHILLQGEYLSGERIEISNLAPGFYLIKIDEKTLKFSKL